MVAFVHTGNDLIVQTMILSSGTHLTLPTVVLNFGESASLGTGTCISTLLAVDRLLNWLLAYMQYSFSTRTGNTETSQERCNLQSVVIAGRIQDDRETFKGQGV